MVVHEIRMSLLRQGVIQQYRNTDFTSADLENECIPTRAIAGDICLHISQDNQAVFSVNEAGSHGDQGEYMAESDVFLYCCSD